MDIEIAQQTEYYLQILNSELQNRKQKNKNYSLRAFAKFLGLSHTLLSLALLKKRGLSQKMAEKICTKLNLNQLERDMFVRSVEKCFSRSPQKKYSAVQSLQRLEKHKQLKLNQESVVHIDHWAYIAVFESIYSKKARTPNDICFLLDQKPSLITKILNHLTDISAISLENGFYVANSSSLQSSNDIPTSAIVNYHVSVSTKAIEAVKLQSVQKREFQNSILTVKPEQLTEAKQMIRSFIYDFNNKFYVENENTKIYSLSVSFFNLERSSL